VPVPPTYLPILARAAFLHDIGKMAIPDSILRKPGPLDNQEKTIMRTHCEIGHKMLIRIPFLRDAAEIVLAHQEFYDGSGYPRGLKEHDIPMSGRICAISDVFDALTSVRPYKEAWPVEAAIAEIARGAGQHFDPWLAKAFKSVLPEILRLKEEYSDAAQPKRPELRRLAS